ncbi:MAG: GNAT family N-acetyltransferase [Planctomycetaceae bacterium]|nr:GNAT family N-acetyltransferase [Planctomycetaceae bacterium]
MDRILIRECCDSDRAEADAVTAKAFESLRRIYRPTREAIEMKRRRPPAPRLIAIHTNQLDENLQNVGTIIGSVEYEVLEDQLSMMALAVHPEWRRRGIARLLIAKLREIGRDRGVSRLTLWTILETGNVPIFEQLGFRVVQVENADLFESDQFEELEEAFMELRLSGG